MRRNISFVLRTQGDPHDLAGAARVAVREVAPTVPISGVRTMESVVAATVAAPRFRTLLITVFASVATFLAAVGIAGVMAYTISQRVGEIAARMALGAKPRDVLGLVVGQAARLTGLGLVIGVAGAFLISRTLASFLFGVPPTDITVFAAVAVVLTAVALVSSYLPAIRAMRD